jgi:ATP-binding cassette subfamily F protein uup
MNLLSVENIAKSFGERVLFQNINFGISKNQKVAFLAKNGTGKTALLNIISGKDEPDTGKITFRKGVRFEFVSQEDDFNPELTIEEAIFDSDNIILQVIAQYEKALENMDDADAYQAAFEKMEQYQAWDFETQYKQIISKFKLTEHLDKKIINLSGGQRKRLSLAISLIHHPDILILDEPTNHLDLEMIEWLEKYFAKTNITLLMVTHDRYFLERVCDEILSLEDGEIFRYKGNYSYYLQKKEERIELEQTVVNKAKNLFKKELDWMRRQPKARTTKSKSRIDDFHKIKEKASKRRSEHKVQLEINMKRVGNKILELHNVCKSYDALIILDNFNYTFKKGERIGIIGKNGTGKSTLLKLIMGLENQDAGKIIKGETIQFGYYSQDGITVKPGQKVIEVIQEFGDYIPLSKGRKITAGQLLERFMFSRKQQHDYVEKLSGGEQKRLYLCTVLIQNPNFLILDEPTNDLDILTLQVLEEFLLDFPGNIIVVSHDRYFMDKITDHLFIFEGDGITSVFPGNYSDYRAYEDSKPKEEAIDKVKKESTRVKTVSKKLSYNDQKEFNNLEKDIPKLQKEKKAIEKRFENETLDNDAIQELSASLEEIIRRLEEKEERWLEISMELE